MTDPDDSSTATARTPSADAAPAPPGSIGLWQRPAVRGAANGAFFAAMLCVIQVYGIFRPARPLDHDTIAGNLMAGVVFGVVMYIVEFWRMHRRGRVAGRSNAAAEAARRTVEARLRGDRSDGPDAPR